MSRRRRRGGRRGGGSGGGGAPFSLFAFQDIMAAVTGVMIVTTLLLVIDLLTRVVATASADLQRPEVGTAEDGAAERTAVLAMLEREAAAEVVTEAALERLAARVLAEQRMAAAALERAVASERMSAAARTEARGRDARAAAAAVELAATREAVAEARRRPAVTLLEGEAGGKATWWVRLSGGAVEAAPLRQGAAATEATGEAYRVRSWADAEAFLAEVLAGDASERGWVLLVEPGGVASFHAVQEALRRAGFDVGWDLALAPKDGDAVGGEGGAR